MIPCCRNCEREWPQLHRPDGDFCDMVCWAAWSGGDLVAEMEEDEEAIRFYSTLGGEVEVSDDDVIRPDDRRPR